MKKTKIEGQISEEEDLAAHGTDAKSFAKHALAPENSLSAQLDITKISGSVYRCGDNVDTDVIIPARHLNINDPAELAKHAMEDLDPNFLTKLHDIIVGGKNFGSGSSREHAPLALKAAGVKAIIAKSFSRIFYRNAINIGLPVIILPEADQIGSDAIIDLAKGTIESKGKKFTFAPYAKEVSSILKDGGLVAYLKKKLKGKKN